MSYLIQAPPYIFAYIATLVVSWSSGKHMEHCYHIIACTISAIIGVIIMITTLNAGARYFGMFLLCAGPFVGLNVRLYAFYNICNDTDIISRSTFHGKRPTCLDLVRKGRLLLPSRTASPAYPTGFRLTSSYDSLLNVC